MDIPISLKARQHCDRGHQLKTQGQFDAALTEFRRAILIDPQLFEAHLEVGLICKARLKNEPALQRHAFDAFRHAARLNLQHEQAHNEYIMAAQKTNQLDELIREYDAWIQHYPDNPLLLQCKKNLITISMAMIPQQIHVGAGPSSFLKKAILLISLGAILFGLVLIFLPPMFKKVQPADAKRFLQIGVVFCAVGVGGIMARSRIKN